MMFTDSSMLLNSKVDSIIYTLGITPVHHYYCRIDQAEGLLFLMFPKL